MKKHKQSYTINENNLGFKRILNNAHKIKNNYDYDIIELNNNSITEKLWYEIYLKIKRGKRK